MIAHFVAEGEPVESFRLLAQDLLEQFPPKNVIEEQKVQRLTDLFWKLRRYRAFETYLLNGPNSGDLSLPTSLKQYRAKAVDETFKWFEYLDAYTERIWKEIKRLVEELEADRVRPARSVTIEGKAGRT